jgi:hypothetical protein
MIRITAIEKVTEPLNVALLMMLLSHSDSGRLQFAGYHIPSAVEIVQPSMLLDYLT